MARDRGASRVYMTDVSRRPARYRARRRREVRRRRVGGRRGQRRRGGAVADRRARGPNGSASLRRRSRRSRPRSRWPPSARRVVYFAGLPKHDPVSPLDMNQLHYKELAILGAYGATHRQYRITMDYLNRRRDDLARRRDAPVPARADRRGVRDDPVGRRAEDGHRAVTAARTSSAATSAARERTPRCTRADGTLVASAYEAYDLSFPYPTWAEQDPDLWVGAMRADGRAAVSEVPEGASAIKGLSFGSQLDGMVVCDADGPAAAAGDDLDGPPRRGAGRRRSPSAMSPRGRSTAHVGREPRLVTRGVQGPVGARRGAGASGTARRTLMPPGTYVLRAVSGVIGRRLLERVVARAARSPVPDVVGRRCWTSTGIDRAMLPELRRGDPVGRHDHGGVRRGDRPGASTQVAVGCGDEMAATLGAGVFAPGEVCDVVGTAEPVCAASAEPREDPTMLVECHPHADPDAWLLENPGFVSGGNLRWWRDQFAPIERAAEAEGLGDAYDFLSTEAATRPAGRRGARVPAVHAGRDGAGVERRRPRRVLRADARAHAGAHDARGARGERVRAARHPGGDDERRARTCAG